MHFSPNHAPNLGGLWEAVIWSMKNLLRNILGSHVLMLKEFTTVLIYVDAAMNSRPLAPWDRLNDDKTPTLLFGLFLIQLPLLALLSRFYFSD